MPAKSTTSKVGARNTKPTTGATPLPSRKSRKQAEPSTTGLADLLPITSKRQRPSRAKLVGVTGVGMVTLADKIADAVKTGDAVELTVVGPTADEIRAMGLNARLAVAKTENEAVKAWKSAVKDGSTDPRPATPILDWMASTPKNERMASAAKSSGTRSSARYSGDVAETLKARIGRDRAAGLGFPKIATALNAEGFAPADWTGPKLYAFACRNGLGDKLSAVKSS